MTGECTHPGQGNAHLFMLAARGVECGTHCRRCGATLRAEPNGGWSVVGGGRLSRKTRRRLRRRLGLRWWQREAK